MNNRGFSGIGLLLFLALCLVAGFWVVTVEPALIIFLGQSPVYGPGTDGYVIFLGIPFILVIAGLWFLLRPNNQSQFA